MLPFEEENQSHPSETPIPEKETPKLLTMKRVIFWSHHLVAPSKRKQFAAWCPELQVWGLLKLGYPGFLLFEGETDDIDDMVRRVKVRCPLDTEHAMACYLYARRSNLVL